MELQEIHNSKTSRSVKPREFCHGNSLPFNLSTISTEFAQQDVRTLHGFPEIHTKGSMFAELSESINLEKLSKQISALIVVATQRLNDLDMKKVSSEITATSESLRRVLLA